MQPELNNKPRRLSISDISKGKEFTIAQVTSINDLHHPEYSRQLRVGDVIKIHNCYETGFQVSVNGKLTNFGDRILVSIDDVGDIIVLDEE